MKNNSYRRKYILKIILTCVLTSASIVGYGLISDYLKAQAAQKEAADDTSPAFPRLAPTLESELTDSISPSNDWNLAQIANPFVNKTGVGDGTSASGRAVGSSLPPIPGGNSAALPGFPNGVARGGALPAGAPFPPAGALPPIPSPGASDEMTRNLLRERVRRARLGLPVEAESTVYSTDDLLAVGVVGSGGRASAMFYIKPLRRAESFPLKTRFRNAVLTSVVSEGVYFQIDGIKDPVLKKWSRSVKNQSDDAVTILDPVK